MSADRFLPILIVIRLGMYRHVPLIRSLLRLLMAV
nr:MAG TPA: hypothetical protein [Caudoviricetes sp.]